MSLEDTLPLCHTKAIKLSETLLQVGIMHEDGGKC